MALAAAAVATERLKLGTGICLVVERDPIITAKEVASIDQLSGGRFLFGVGAGWNIEEMENHGTNSEAALLAPARAGRGDEGDLDAGRGRVPRRARGLRPDLVLAEAGAAAPPAGAAGRQRGRRCWSGWWRSRTSGCPILFRVCATAWRSCGGWREEAGRDPIPVTLNAAKPDRDAIARGEESGVHRCVFYVQPAERGEVERQLDELAGLL